VHRLSRIRKDESGIAMVVAMLVVFVVVLLSIVIMDLSIHNADQAAYDRKRVTSVAASEAGIDKAWNLVQYSPPEDLPCGAPETGTLGSAPGPASYSIDFRWLDASGGTLTCPLSQLNVPSSVLVTSTGTTNTNVPRTMQAYMTLAPTYGGFDAAIMSVTSTTFNNNFTVTGSSSSNGDVFILNGNLTISNAPTIYGNVYVPTGSASMSNNSSIVGELWANNGVTVSSPASVTGDVSSSTSSLSGTGTIGGDATAGTTIAASLSVSGTKYANSPQGPPPTQILPKGCQVAIAGVCNALPWTGYTVTTYSGASACTDARTFLLSGTITGNRVVWIDQVCNLAIANNDVINFTGNLAIVTQGSITMNNHNDWNGVAGKKLVFMVNYRTIFTAGCSSSYNITTGNNSNFVNASVLFYSPCTVTLNNQNNFAGQVLANSVVINNHFTLDATKVLVEGLGDILGFNQSIVYLREVIS
jgi:hypothetical protein